MIDLTPLVRRLAGTPLAAWANSLQAQLDARMDIGHGDLERWQGALDALPDLKPTDVQLRERFRLDAPCADATRAQLRKALLGLSPWRKGPFDLFGVHIDTEWRSDWKWARVAPHLDLHGKRVLDVGCGNGYYQWRMLGAGADSVVGVDPNWLFFCQFHAMKRYLQELPVWHLPFALEELLARCSALTQRFSLHQAAALSVGSLVIERSARRALRQGVELKLSLTGFKILTLLAEAHPRVLTRSELTERLWQGEPPDSDALRTHLYQLRQALDRPFAVPMLLTVHGVGFRLDGQA